MLQILSQIQRISYISENDTVINFSGSYLSSPSYKADYYIFIFVYILLLIISFNLF